jgi:two-component system response regulator HydG
MSRAATSILVADDDQAHRTMLATLLGGWGYAVAEADDGRTAVEAVRRNPFDLILMDIRMLDVSGLEALARIKTYNPAIPVIIMTAFSSVDTAVQALKSGAYDYLTKPLDFDNLRLTMERAMDHVHLQEENRLLKESLGRSFDRGRIIGQSPLMIHLLETVAHVAASEATVMLTGESGTGKELIAGAIHFNSLRKAGPFVKINCAAITETLLESELFGHEKGAFTGADRRKEGRFRQAHGGSLFLDEIGEMPLTMQAKLLRVIQEREITRVGGEDVVPVDVRLIVATNRDLYQLTRTGGFREDLYYRLNVVSLDVPPLRRRPEDIPLLAQHFLTLMAARNNKTIKGFTPKAMNLLIKSDWPGNVRQLMNAIERAVVLTRQEFVGSDDLFLVPGDPSVAAVAAAHGNADGQALEQVQRQAVLAALEACGGNKSQTARRLGITRKTLHQKLKKYGVMP